MTKSTKLILILSLAANAVLFAGLAAGYVSIKRASANAGAAQPKESGGALSPEAAKETKALLTTDDMAALRDKLRALGLPESMVKEVVKARITSRYTARLREIGNAALEAARQRPYWRRDTGGDFVGGVPTIYTPEQQKEMDKINREKMDEDRQLFGADDTATSFASLRYAFLSPEKAAQLQKIQGDYQDLKTQALREMAGFRMPGDEAKLKMIDDEQQRDTLALLTPEEKEANDLRNTQTAWQLQRAFVGFNGTEDEYKAIFALQKELEDKYPYNYSLTSSGGVDTSALWQARSEEQKNIDAQIKDMLGDARYADYVRGQRRDYQSLMAAAERFDLSAEAVVQTYQVRDDTANEAKRISDDSSLTTEQKNEAYAALAEQATAQIKAALGDEVGDAYINNALGWLKNLPKGGTVTIDPKGNVNVTQPKAGKKGR